MKIAIIGSGISGLGCAWLLNYHGHDVHIFEKNDYIGGHSNTVQIKGHPAIDTGFIVYNDWTYPNLIALFDHLNVRTAASDMSFAVSKDKGALEYASDALFAQPNNFFSPRFYRMIVDIVRFYKHAPNLLQREGSPTLGEYLDRNHYSKTFKHDHLYPMGAAIWSMGAEDIQHFPAKAFIRFFVNHGLLLLKGRPQWRTVLNGSQEYVAKLCATLKNKPKLNTCVQDVQCKDGQVFVDGEAFDHVVFACHSDQSAALTPNAQAKTLLSDIKYSSNTAYLHTDETQMPKNKKCWSSWNYLTSQKGKVTLTYWMNKLQKHIGSKQNYFVTLNPETPIEAGKILKEISYTHPCFTQSAMQAQAGIKTIQGLDNLWYCGAWCGYGFHEDGLVSGLKIAEAISGKIRLWNVNEEKSSSAINTF